jgi:hypothetical protein
VARAQSRAPETVLRNYFRAKDEDRPDLMGEVFCEDAALTIRVKAASISFPESSRGLAAITDALIRQFRQSYDDVRSFYLDRPGSAIAEFSCDWLVGMSERSSGNVRVGCGRYDWKFQPAPPRLATDLLITIEVMEILSPSYLDGVQAWFRRLSYPWTSAPQVVAAAPAIEALNPVLKYLRGDEAQRKRS